MKRIKVKIKGIAPILFNRMTEETQDNIAKGKTGGRLSIEDKRTQALTKVYRNGHGLYCPAQNIKKAMLTGCQKASLKYGKKGLAPFLEALVFVEEAQVLFGKDEPDFIDERVGRVPPRTGGRVIIYRPGLYEDWRLEFHLMVVDDRIPLDHIKTAMEEAGILAGLCDHRPEYGRFVVEKWEEVKAKGK